MGGSRGRGPGPRPLVATACMHACWLAADLAGCGSGSGCSLRQVARPRPLLQGATDEAARLEQDAQRVNEVRAQQLAIVGKRRGRRGGSSGGGGGGGTEVKSTGSPARPQQPQHQHQHQQPGEAQR